MDGGGLSWCGIPGGKSTQPTLPTHHAAICGAGKCRSAKQPAAMLRPSDAPSPTPVQYTVEPHCGQKCNSTARRLVVAERTKTLLSPLTATACVPVKYALTPNTLPVRRWHWVQ